MYRILKALIIAVWVGCTAWLIRYEAYPQWFEETVQGYRALARELPAIRDSSLQVRVPELASGVLNVDRISPDDDQVRLKATLELLNLPPLSFDQTFSLPSEAIVASPLLDIGLSQLRKGEELRIRTLNPFSFDGSTQTLTLRGEGTEVWPEGPDDEEVKVSKVSMELEDMVMYAYVDEYGRVLRQETPLGFYLEYSSSTQAVQVPEENALDLNQFLNSSPLPTLPTLPLTP